MMLTRLRRARHNAGLVLATKSYRPWELVAREEYKSRAEAMRREKWLKSGVGRKYVWEMVTAYKKQYDLTA